MLQSLGQRFDYFLYMTTSFICIQVLQSLGQRFDYFLAQASFIRSLFVAVNDEVFYVREAAIMVLGRLTQLNPAHVMPALRRMLVQVSS